MKLSTSNTFLVGFKSRKAAQICAYLALKCRNHIEKLKLIKLVYLAERESLRMHGQPMIYDEMFSLKDGPVCSNTLDGINHCNRFLEWKEYLQREDRIVTAIKEFSLDNYDDLSKADIEVLDSVFDSFGHMTASQIRAYTHKYCPEYTEVTSGRVPISYKDVLVALGDENAEELSEAVSAHRRAESILGKNA